MLTIAIPCLLLLQVVPDEFQERTPRCALGERISDPFTIAWEKYSREIELDPKCQRAYRDRGLLLMQRHATTMAIKDFNEALRLDPKDHVALYHRGIANSQLGNYEASIADYSKCIKQKPKSALAIPVLHPIPEEQARELMGKYDLVGSD